MGKITRFEQLECWQAARELVKEVYMLSATGKFERDFDTRNQFRRAALSSMNNIAEGFGRYSTREFIRFLEVSQRSVLEVQSMLYVMDDLAYMDENVLTSLRSKSEKTKALTLGLIKYLRGKSKSQKDIHSTP